MREKLENLALKKSETNSNPFESGNTDVFNINQKNCGKVFYGKKIYLFFLMIRKYNY
jgi:hypothetical protein